MSPQGFNISYLEPLVRLSGKAERQLSECKQSVPISTSAMLLMAEGIQKYTHMGAFELARGAASLG